MQSGSCGDPKRRAGRSLSVDQLTRRTTMNFKRIAASLAVSAVMVNFIPLAIAKQKTVMVGGAAMYPTKNIVENAVKSKDHTTLVAAVKAAGLVDTLQGPGPYTVFAPTNA